MAEQKRFQKITLNSDDYKRIEGAAKATKWVGGLVAAAVGTIATGVFLKDQYSDGDKNSNDKEEQEKD